MTEFRLLGPVEIWAGGRRVPAGHPRQRAVLAALLVDAGRVVAWDALVDRVWGEDAPDNARATLRAHMARIRRVLEEVRTLSGEATGLRHGSGGYLLDVDPDLVDLHRFRRMSVRAREPGWTDATRAAWLREALALWRGQPLSGLGGAWADRMRGSWDRERLDAVVAWAGAEVRTGNPQAVLGTLTELAEQHPLVESLIAALMRALHANGRTADALDLYTRARQRLADELGVDPGDELRAAQHTILGGGPAPPRPDPLRRLVPAQLPADLAAFAGRTSALARLDALLEQTAAAATTAVMISSVSGSAGVGKTTLAVHWAHRVANRFPDGQLYVNLRGYDQVGQVMPPAEAVRGFLDALGVAPERVPTTLDAQTGLYRSLMAGRRILVLLDNARDAEHVRPLLPGTPTAMVLVTSRDRLLPLVATDGAHPLALDVLSDGEAHELLVRRLGRDRVADEPRAVEAIADACAGLPLALAIAAARAQQPASALPGIAAELSRAGGRLDAFDAGDAYSRVRSVFSWSYAILAPDTAALFRRLGLHPGPDISAAAAASLAGCPPGQAQPLLAELTRASLLSQHAPGRYATHDLLRAYAADLAQSVDPQPVRDGAVARMLDHYLHTAHLAARLMYPHRDPIPLPLGAPAPGTHLEDLPDDARAVAWLTAEHEVLLALLRFTAGAGFDAQTLQLAWALNTYLDRRGHWHDLVAAWETATRAAGRLPGRPARAVAHRLLARAYTRLGREQAHDHLQLALDLYAQAGDTHGEAMTHLELAMLREREGDPGRALPAAQRALALFESTGHEQKEANALNAVGWYHALLGDHAAALDYCGRALTLLRRVGDRSGEAGALDSLGYAYHRAGDYARAADCLERSLVLQEELGERRLSAITIGHLGDTYQAAGNLEAARATWRRALRTFLDLDDPHADEMRAKLDALDAAAASPR